VTALALRDVRKSFGDQAVLTGIDLEVASGSFTALLGASGSGKTTLLRLIAGFERLDQGEILLDGEIVEDAKVHLAPEHRHLGVVPQDGALFPHLTIKANIEFGLSRRRRRTSNVRDLLTLVGLTGLDRRYPHELSGGERQRAALARALAVEPRLVVLDEPFSSLDAGLRQTLRHDVREILQTSGATALLVTHDQDEALSLADTVAVLRDGHIVQHATPTELYQMPHDEALAAFVGDANIIDGTRDGDHARTAFGLIELRAERPDPATSDLRVLVRPEQVRISRDATSGVRAEVLDTSYFGHTSITRLRPLDPCGIDVVIARIDGDAAPVSGARVTLTATGPSTAWPRVAPDLPTRPA
jgi:iron(III) transport system ATP-binding protein